MKHSPVIDPGIHEALIRAAGAGIAAWTVARGHTHVRFSVWNDAMVALTGYTRDEVNEDGWLQTSCLVPLEGPQGDEATVDWGRCPDEVSIRRKDGERRALRLVTRGVIEGGTQFYVCVATDVTEEKLTEARLTRSEARYRLLIQEASDAIFVHGPSGVILDVNMRACELLGYSQHELIGMKPADFDVQTTPEQFVALGQAMGTGETLTLSTVHRRRDGTTFPVEIRLGSCMVEGQAIGLSIVRDMTERARAEAELRASEQRCRLALEASGLGTWMLPDESGVTFLDARCQAHSGVTESHVSAQQLLSRIHPDDLDRVMQAIEGANHIAGPEASFTSEHRLVHDDGQVRWVDARGRVFRTPEGDGYRMTGVIGTTNDITERKRTEAVIRWQARVLEQIASGAGLVQVLGQISRFVEELVPGVRCSVGVLARDGVHLRFRSAERMPPEYVKVIDGLTIGPGRGCCGAAAHEGRPVIVEDARTHPNWVNFQGLVERFQLKACWSFPVFDLPPTDTRRRVLGTFALYPDTYSSPDQAALEVVLQATWLAGIAIARENALVDIREAETRYNLVAELTRSVTLAIRSCPDGTSEIEWARPRFGLLSGYSREDLKTIGWENLVHPDDRARVTQLYASLCAGATVRGEFRYRTKDGRWLPLLFNGRLIEEEDEANTGLIVGAILDLTELRETESALRISEERFQLAMLGASDGLWDWDVKAGTMFHSPRWKSMLGYREDELSDTPETWTTLIHPDDLGLSQQRLAEFLSGTAVAFRLEYRMRHKDGTYRSILSRGHLGRDTDGQPRRLVGTHVDITERKEVEAALRRSEEELLHAQALAQVGSWRIDFDTGMGIGSNECNALLGWGPGPHSTAEFTTRLHPDDLGLLDEAWAQLLREGECALEHRLLIDGQEKWVSSFAKLLPHSGTGAPLVLGVTQDITVRRRLEAQLRQSQKMEAIGQLAGGVAHDFNNLLTVINGSAELLLADLDPHSPIVEELSQIRQAGDRAAGLTRQLLAFSRQQILSPRTIELNQVVVETGRMLGRLIGENIQLLTRLDHTAHQVKADPHQLQQVLLNLAVNARDAMPGGGVITIETAGVRLELPGSEGCAGVRLSISDTGTGMSQEVKDKLFEPFFTTKGVGKGTGLGLATVYGIVRQSGGSISVESELGSGTTFHIVLPLAGPDPAVVSPESAPGPPRGGESILLVEDEPTVRRVTRTILKRLGYNVIEAANGLQATELLAAQSGRVDLLVTDVIMPEMGGRDLADWVAERYPGLTVLFVSGYMDDAVVRHGVLQGRDHLLQKPYTPAALAQRVRELLDKRP